MPCNSSIHISKNLLKLQRSPNYVICRNAIFTGIFINHSGVRRMNISSTGESMKVPFCSQKRIKIFLKLPKNAGFMTAIIFQKYSASSKEYPLQNTGMIPVFQNPRQQTCKFTERFSANYYCTSSLFQSESLPVSVSKFAPTNVIFFDESRYGLKYSFFLIWANADSSLFSLNSNK